LEAEANGDLLQISGRVVSKIPCDAVLAYVDPKGGGDYDAKTVVGRPEKNGAFAFSKLEVPRTETQIRLVAYFANGETIKLSVDVERMEASGKIKANSLFEVPTQLLVKRAETAVARGSANAAALIQNAKLGLDPAEAAEQFREIGLLEKWLQPAPKLVDLITANAKSMYLSDATWESAKSGWAGTPRDWRGADPVFGQGLFLHMAGKLHEKGLPAHCPAEHVFSTA
jgi:hypothetical protein